LKLGN